MTAAADGEALAVHSQIGLVRLPEGTGSVLSEASIFFKRKEDKGTLITLLNSEVGLLTGKPSVFWLLSKKR